jgi:hypothetical protein
MIDRRTLILNRLVAILGDVVEDIEQTNAPLVFRNRGEIPRGKNGKLPAMVLLDGSEEAVVPRQSQRGGPPPSIMRMRPEIFALLKEKDKGKESEYAAEVAEYRNQMFVHVMFDSQLLDIMGPNGGIVYRGFETDFQTGRSMWGELQLFFDFTYPLIPSELQEV